MISSHARCDNCERMLVPMAETEHVTEEDLLGAGWVLVRWEEDEKECNRDFCSSGCAGKWLVKESEHGETVGKGKEESA